MTCKLVLLRHGGSKQSARNLSTDWADVPLSEKGRAEAAHDGGLLKSKGTLPDILHISLLCRVIMTTNLALDATDRHWILIRHTWRLNERHCGALQGMSKKTIHGECSEELFMQWRRSYDVPPPAVERDSEFSQDADPRYAGEPIPLPECLGDVLECALPYWDDAIIPDLKAGRTVVIAAHGSSLRAIVKHLDPISSRKISGLNIPTGIPLYYELGEDMKPVAPGHYLDP